MKVPPVPRLTAMIHACVAGQCGMGDSGSWGNSPYRVGRWIPPVRLGTGRTAVALAYAGHYGGTTCAVLDNRLIKCWGLNQATGIGSSTPANIGTSYSHMGDALEYAKLGGNTTNNFTSYAASAKMAMTYATACAVMLDGRVKCWGASDMYGVDVGECTIGLRTRTTCIYVLQLSSYMLLNFAYA